MRPRILVTGFGPFPGAPYNPTGALAHALARGRHPLLRGATVRARVLPTHWPSVATLIAELERDDPDVVLMLGLAAARRHVCIERLAVDAAEPLPDAAGALPPVGVGEPAHIGCAAPAPRLLKALRAAGLPARHSDDAGRYLCNALAFAVYARAGATGRPRRAVFVHVPLAAPRGRLLRGLQGVLAALVARG